MVTDELADVAPVTSSQSSVAEVIQQDVVEVIQQDTSIVSMEIVSPEVLPSVVPPSSEQASDAVSEVIAATPIVQDPDQVLKKRKRSVVLAPSDRVSRSSAKKSRAAQE